MKVLNSLNVGEINKIMEKINVNKNLEETQMIKSLQSFFKKTEEKEIITETDITREVEDVLVDVDIISVIDSDSFNDSDLEDFEDDSSLNMSSTNENEIQNLETVIINEEK